ncbi:MAG: hypothetical protein HRT87_04525 [Legionellales bacterium]|nr:hypothetical protein [Legionellales bacterium]
MKVKNNITIKGKIIGKELKFSMINQTLFNEFAKTLPDNTEVELYISTVSEKASRAQIKKIHAMLRELGNTCGYELQEIKDLVKTKADLTEVKDKKIALKSFGDCTREEMQNAIEAAIQIGDMLGVNLR